MPFDFKQDLAEFRGQEQPERTIGGSETQIGTIGSLVGKSPVKKTFDFEEDLATFKDEKIATDPVSSALDVQNFQDKQQAIADKEAENRRNEMTLEMAGIDPKDPDSVHSFLASKEDRLMPTANIEIDYANQDLSQSEITAVPQGTVGGHCGVYAENVVKLPGGGNWIVGDTIGEKTQSIDRYREAGLAFKPGEDAPQAGNALIINPGTKWGHVAVINKIDEDGNITLTESNWNWDKRVTHDRVIKADDPSIVGFIRTE